MLGSVFDRVKFLCDAEQHPFMGHNTGSCLEFTPNVESAYPGHCIDYLLGEHCQICGAFFSYGEHVNPE